MSANEEPPSKRRKHANLSHSSSLNRAISPPPLRRQTGSQSSSSSLDRRNTPDDKPITPHDVPHPNSLRIHAGDSDDEGDTSGQKLDQKPGSTLIIASPFKLTRIKDLPATKNFDTVTLNDIIGDPMIRELWSFNYMHNIPFIVQNMDPDTRQACKISIVHGYWKSDDPSRLQLESDITSLQSHSISLVSAYLPDPFGTHHTKMLVLLRHDDTLEIVVHTANMIPFDWTNMTQAVWRSPRLPLLYDDATEKRESVGYTFKQSFTGYLQAYGKKRCGNLVEEVRMYDFESVRAVFVGHVPGKHEDDGDAHRLFGWVKARNVLSSVPVGGGLGVNKAGKKIGLMEKKFMKGSGHLVAQVSSIASLGTTDKYLTSLIFPALCPSPAAKYSVVWPTVEDVRTSCNGWQSGTAIHVKGSKPAEEKQLTWLQPMLSRWGGSSSSASSTSSSSIPKLEAGRAKAAPHIKTFTRFSPVEANAEKKTQPAIDWSLFTSANLSKQAWGSESKSGEVHIQSYEAGVLIHPGLWVDLLADDAETPSRVEIQGIGMKDYLNTDDVDADKMESSDAVASGRKYRRIVVGLRLPYDYPLTPYTQQDSPWIVRKDYGDLRDWTGSQWPPRNAGDFME